MVAVKVFPAGWKDKFTAEKEVYELPLMKHAGIVHFLGTGREPGGGSGLIVLQFAEYVSGNRENGRKINGAFCPFSDRSKVIKRKKRRNRRQRQGR